MLNKDKKKMPILLLLLTAILTAFIPMHSSFDETIEAFIVDTKKQDLQFYWRGEKGENLKSIQNVKKYVENKNLKLIFAMNGGMFDKSYSPNGLFIENNKKHTGLNISDGTGNFYLKPNGIFYITNDKIPFVCQTIDFRENDNIKFATQSGPMLIINEKIHPSFNEGSTNINIRNGVGILPDNKVVFAISKTKINLYDFAKYFQRLGCKNALYLDGFVSRMYLPEKGWTQTDGSFGVIIGVTQKHTVD